LKDPAVASSRAENSSNGTDFIWLPQGRNLGGDWPATTPCGILPLRALKAQSNGDFRNLVVRKIGD